MGHFPLPDQGQLLFAISHSNFLGSIVCQMAGGREQQTRLTWREYGLRKRDWNALVVILVRFCASLPFLACVVDGPEDMWFTISSLPVRSIVQGMDGL